MRITSSQRRRLKLLGTGPWIEDRRWKRCRPAFLVGATHAGLKLVNGRGESLEEALADAGLPLGTRSRK